MAFGGDESRRLYAAKQVPELIEVPERRFIAIDGSGDPERSVGFELAVDALYSVAHALRFVVALDGGGSFTIPPLEALWWTEEETVIDLVRRTASVRWRAMIPIPDGVTQTQLDRARHYAGSGSPNLEIENVRLTTCREGLCVQVLHVGPYSKERQTIERLQAFANANNRRIHGKHHEIYLGDAKETRAHKLRTILRQPVD